MQHTTFPPFIIAIIGAVNRMNPEVLEEIIDNYGSQRAEDLFTAHFNIVMFSSDEVELDDDQDEETLKDKLVSLIEEQERKTHPQQFTAYGIEFTVCTKLARNLASQVLFN